MIKIPTSISKRVLWRYVNIKINRVIHHFHVMGIISILFDEMLRDLKANKSIKIHNFGEIKLKDMPSRNYFNVRLQKVMHARGKKILRFTLKDSIRKKIIRRLDVDKTFPND